MMNNIAMNIKNDLIENGVNILFNQQVVNIEKEYNEFIVETLDNEFIAKKIVLAVGRIGSRQLKKIADKLNIFYENEGQEIELGVRIEAPYEVFDTVNNIHNDLKLKMKTKFGELRTFCQDYRGFITRCIYNLPGDKIISSLDGHIIGTSENNGKLSDVVNLAVHHRYKVNYSIEKIYDIIENINISHKPIVESMKNFMENKNAKNIFKNKLSMPDVIEGNINDFLPEKSLYLIKDFIIKIDKVLPGFAESTNVVYAPSFEMGWKKFNLNDNLETNVSGIYIGGDATGHFRGAMQSMISGLIIGKNIVKGF